MKDYRVELDVYNGPLDLLLFLIRREEVDIHDIPIARITAQYVAYVKVIERFDPNAAGEFIVLAATLMEIKSRMMLPRPPEVEEEDDIGDPRLELVRQLLEYKKYKDAANRLSVAGELQALRHRRHPPPLESGPHELDVEDLEIWDLFDAFSKLLEQTGRRTLPHEVVYDDTPLALHATDILDSLERAGGSQRFEQIFEGRSKSQLIGLFLALLELIRKQRIRAHQDGTFNAITIHLLDSSPIEEGFDEAFEAGPDDEYDRIAAEEPGGQSDESPEADADEHLVGQPEDNDLEHPFAVVEPAVELDDAMSDISPFVEPPAGGQAADEGGEIIPPRPIDAMVSDEPPASAIEDGDENRESPPPDAATDRTALQ